MKVYVNNRDYLTWPKLQVSWFLNHGHDVTIIDNASTYEPLLNWYATKPCSIVFLGENLGHLAPWRSRAVDASDYYAVTDPDLSFDGIPPDWPEVCVEGIRRGAMKCGFSLEELGVPSRNPAWLADGFYLHPRGLPALWGPRVRPGDGYIRYPVDTTFAVYAPGGRYGVGGWRTDRPYTARHLPWHIVPNRQGGSEALEIPMDDEIFYYFTHASDVSRTKARLQPMLAAYEGMKRGAAAGI